jgi:hypothetical protein
MAYKFNNGSGAVTCDVCNRIIDAYLSHVAYREAYPEPVICWRCKDKMKKQEEEKENE